MNNKIIKVFGIALIFGYIFELIMTNFWHYNMLTSILGAPWLIVIFWGISLTLAYLFINRIKNTWPDYIKILVLYIPFIIILEYIGNQIMKITISKSFTCLMGNFMCAPLVYYIALYFVALTFWYSVKYINQNN